MISFEDLLALKRKIYETAWHTFVYLIRHRIDPTPENYKLHYERFFQEEQLDENPIKGILKKTDHILGHTTSSLEDIIFKLYKVERKPPSRLQYYLNRIISKIEKEKGSLEKLREEVQKVENELEAVSRDRYIDPLTGIWNRLALQEFLPQLPKLAMERNIVVAFLDLNKFKEINDKYGHLVGDEVLKYFAAYIRANLKHKDFFARYGGDEFVVILFDIDLEEAKHFFEKLRKSIPPIKIDGKKIRIDFCVGLTVPFGSDSPKDILNRADMAMYECKKSKKVEIKLK